MGTLEKLLVLLESSPWDAVYRLAIGFATVSVFSHVFGKDRSVWAFVAFLLGVLFMLRVAPAVFRRVMPFSDTVQQVWAERRQLAKRYDSYQWQKLLWIGAGLALNAILSNQILTSRMMVSSIC